jgi:hypothetical protein
MASSSHIIDFILIMRKKLLKIIIEILHFHKIK